MDNQNYNNKFCPLFKKNYKECYCSKLNSQTIARAVEYCSGNFKKCYIYIKLTEGKLQKEKVFQKNSS